MRRRFLVFALAVFVLVDIGLAIWWYDSKQHSSGRVLEKSTFVCPVPRKYCRKGKVIKSDGHYLGVGYQVPVGTPILAVFNGQTRGGRIKFSLPENKDRFSTILLKGGGDLEASYILTGSDYQGIANFIQGEEIDHTREGEITSFGVNLLIQVWQGEERKMIELVPKDFSR